MFREMNTVTGLLLFTCIASGLGLSDPDDYETVALNLHNKYRALHGAAPLKLDEDVQITAHGYATYLARNKQKLIPKRGLKYGQNLFELNSRNGPLPNDTELVESAINSWYSKSKTHDWINPSLSTFTQLVWRSSDLFGIGIGKNGDRAVVVGMYSPPGNVVGQFRDNVLSSNFHSDSASGVLPPRRYTSTTTTNRPFFVDFDPESASGVLPPRRYTTSTTSTTTSTTTTTAAPAIRQTTSATADLIGDKKPEYSDREIQLLALDLHNYYRSQHGSTPLVLDEELSYEAQKYASALASGKPKSRTPTGQNIFRFSGFALPTRDAVEKAIKEWYKSKSVYNWNDPLSSPSDANLFSQLIWRASTKLGIGYVTKRNGNVVVAFYAPPGNILTNKDYRDNVPPEIN